MTKIRRNITLSKDAETILNQKHVNASGLIDDLVRAYGAYRDVDDAVRHITETRSETRTRALLEVAETLSSIPVEKLDKHNDAVLTQASRVELSPDTIVDIVKHYKNTGELPEEYQT